MSRSQMELLRGCIPDDFDYSEFGEEMVRRACEEIYTSANPSGAEIDEKRRDVQAARMRIMQVVNEWGAVVKGRRLTSEEKFKAFWYNE